MDITTDLIETYKILTGQPPNKTIDDIEGIDAFLRRNIGDKIQVYTNPHLNCIGFNFRGILWLQDKDRDLYTIKNESGNLYFKVTDVKQIKGKVIQLKTITTGD